MSSYRVSELWRYPVKSMQGERLTEVEVTSGGIAYDRSWAVRDESTETIRGAKHFGDLLNCSARSIESSRSDTFPNVPDVEITLPDGRAITSTDPAIDEALSNLVGRRVTLCSLMPAENDAQNARSARPDLPSVEQWRRIMGLEPGEPFPDMGGFPPEMLAEFAISATPRGTYFDAYPIDILTEASIRMLASLCPGSDLDVRRFRPNVLLSDDQNEIDFSENAWIGDRIEIGSAAFGIEVGAVRCVMVTREQPGLARDTRIMRALVRETNQRLSVYASVATPGSVGIGDVVRPTGSIPESAQEERP